MSKVNTLEANNNTVTQGDSAQQDKPKAIRRGAFNGAFARFQTREYGNMVRCGLEKEIAHKVAFDFGSSLGLAIANGDDSLKTKVTKANKDGESKISLSGGGKTKSTDAMNVVRVCQQVDSLFIEGLLKSRNILSLDAIGFEYSKKQDGARDSIREYLADCQDWCKAQAFVD